tara:strand:+ start:1506 stop:2210 length:705 start_codon:yes stop_codon:yes gene_type:complete
MEKALVVAAEQALTDMSEVKKELVSLSDILVVRGAFDNTENVLEALNTAGQSLKFQTVGGLDYPPGPNRILIINCSKHYKVNISAVRQFVKRGGYLITTDWALGRIVAKAFPETISVKNGGVSDGIVDIQPENSILTKDIRPNTKFYVDSGSELINIDNGHAVVPLLKSDGLKSKYQSDLLMCGFQWGEGKVFHTISHFAVQLKKSKELKVHDQCSAMILLTNILAQKALSNGA